MAAPRLWMSGLAAAAAVVVAVLAVTWSNPSTFESRSGQAPVSAPAPSPAIELSNKSKADSAPTPDSSIDVAPSKPAQPVPDTAMPDRLKRRDKWWRSEDEDVTVDSKEALDAARSGDDEAQLVMSARLEICEENRKARDAASKAKPAAAADPEITEQSQHCDALALLLEDGERSASFWRDRAAASGNGPALMAEAMDPDFGTADQRSAALKQAFASRDPGAIGIIESMASLDPTYHTQFMAKPGNGMTVVMGELLSECALGIDCARGSLMFERFCKSGRIGCDRADDIPAIIELRLKSVEFQAAREKSSRVIHDLDGPMENSPEAQAVLRQINAPAK